MVNQMYPPELQLNKSNTSDTEAPDPFRIYIYLFLTVFFLSKIHDKRDDFDFEIVKFPFLTSAYYHGKKINHVFKYYEEAKTRIQQIQRVA